MKIARIAPLSYTPGGLEYFSFIRGGVGADYHQNPEFYQYPDGALLLHWSAYDFDECSSNLVKLYAVSRDRGITWSDPQVFLADIPGGVPYTALLLRLREARTALLFVSRTWHHAIAIDAERRVATAGSDYFQSRTRVYLRRSADGGQSFDYGAELPWELVSGGKTLPGVGFYGSVDAALQLRSGRIVAAFTYLDPARSDIAGGLQHYSAACLFSDDGGQTWRRSQEIVVDVLRGVMEPQIVETAPDRLFCLFRNKSGFLYRTVSTDGGERWSDPAPTALPSPESMPRLIRLRSGSLLLAWNNVSSPTQQPRHPLAAALSRDGGDSWEAPRIVADETGGNQLSNHSLIQLDDGRILAGISHYRDTRPMASDLDVAIFDEAWLQGRGPGG